MTKLCLASLALLTSPSLAKTQANAGDDARNNWTKTCSDWDEWDKPGPPFRVFGSTWYVGTCGIAVLAIVTDDGLILIDTGTEAGADIVAANIDKLGFNLADVKIMLQSHEHFDHVGGTARLKQLSGALLYASAEAAPVMIAGLASMEDPQHGMHDPFPAVRPDDEVVPDVPVVLGDVALIPLRTPGHTPGALSWYWESCDADECRTIVYADSLSPVSSDTYRFSEHRGYVDAYYAGLNELSELDCDILLTPHPSASGMRDKLVAGDLTSGMDCRTYADGVRDRLDARIAREAADTGQ